MSVGICRERLDQMGVCGALAEFWDPERSLPICADHAASCRAMRVPPLQGTPPSDTLPPDIAVLGRITR